MWPAQPSWERALLLPAKHPAELEATVVPEMSADQPLSLPSGPTKDHSPPDATDAASAAPGPTMDPEWPRRKRELDALLALLGGP
jgi:hypothetical protein